MASKILIATVLTLLLIGCSESPDELVASASSPDGGVVLEVRAGEAWTYAPHPIKIVKISDGKETVLEQTELRNDGANLGIHNAKIVWADKNHVTVTLNGQEQEPKDYSYEF